MIEGGPYELGLWTAGITAVFVALNRVWRMFGRQRVEGHKDNAEINVLQYLQRENQLLRERADEFARERNMVMIELGTLRGQLASAETEATRLRARIDQMNIDMDDLRNRFQPKTEGE